MDLQYYIEETIKSAKYGGVEIDHPIGSMTHKKFLGQKIIFDLAKEGEFAENMREIIEDAVGKKTALKFSFIMP